MFGIDVDSDYFVKNSLTFCSEGRACGTVGRGPEVRIQPSAKNIYYLMLIVSGTINPGSNPVSNKIYQSFIFC